MKFSGFSHYLSGILVPVSALRSADSCGCGEFLDLIDLVAWCNETKLDLIQLLPVNDTGDDSSPYSALSAFALHPLYIRIQDLAEYTKLEKPKREKIDQKMKILGLGKEAESRFNYKKVLDTKLSILESLFFEMHAEIAKDPEFKKWIQINPWVEEYAAFRTLKRLHNSEGWQLWRPEYRFGNKDVIQRIWKDKENGDLCRFFAWVQFKLEDQFLQVAAYAKKMGVVLKGDIPILMNEDSADIWAQGQNFLLDLRAGAPPDMFSALGQNWGFPIYNWDYLEKHDYAWWRARLKQADKFYEAYRIDHVLGFFRIWTIDKHQKDGLLGYFYPSIFISRNDLFSLGFDEGRIKWLSEPHISGWKIRENFGMRAIEILGRCFSRIGNEDLYLFKPEIKGEKDIIDLPLMEQEKNALLEMFRNRALLNIEENLYSPTWNFRDCDRYQGLNDGEKQAFEDLQARRAQESEVLWKKQGYKLLSFMKTTVDMLACAEDLGVIPNCVPETLKDLEILGLKIPRWAREWHKAGEPHISGSDYPFLSVCAPSVHDTSTLREWWETDANAAKFWQDWDFEGNFSSKYSPEVAKKVIQKILDCNAAICVFQIQDLFALRDEYRVSDASKERVNIPGTVQASNWSYRIPMLISELLENKSFTKDISELVSVRIKKNLVKKV